MGVLRDWRRILQSIKVNGLDDEKEVYCQTRRRARDYENEENGIKMTKQIKQKRQNEEGKNGNDNTEEGILEMTVP